MFNIGSSLHEARTRQNLDLEEMEQRTKVRAKYLRLLEDERFDQLPGHAYTKGFLQVYADALGLDGRLYVEEYNSRFVAGEDDLSPRLPRGPARSPRRRRERRETRTVAVALAAILVVTAFVIAAWRFGGNDQPQVDGVSPATRTSLLDPLGATARDGDRSRRARFVVHGGQGGRRELGNRSTAGRSRRASSSDLRRKRCSSRSSDRGTSSSRWTGEGSSSARAEH